jgi:predicted neutral ceramidase superfamily lipid hydrolase
VAQVLGFLWYGPIFGKSYMAVIGGKKREEMSDKECKEMDKQMRPVYVLNIIVSIVTILVLSCVLRQYMVMDVVEGVKIALLMWLGFIMPIQAGGALWSGKSKKLSWTMFLLTAGYQLAIMLLGGVIWALFYANFI